MKHLTTLLLTLLGHVPFLFSQNCTYLAYDYFAPADGSPLNGAYSGVGWASAWIVQNNDVTLPGYQVSASPALSYLDLQTLGNHAGGGRVFLTAGRQFDITSGGPFGGFLAGNGNIGANGTTLWASVLLRKELNNDQAVYATLHEASIPWCESCGPAATRVAFGYFGTASNVGGERRWSLRIGSTVYPTAVPVVTGQAAFLASRLDFSANAQVTFYANPATIGNTTPAPVLTQPVGGPVYFRSLALYLGNSPGNGSMDEIRVGESYACVAPDAYVTVYVPPFADFTITPPDGQAPLLVNFDASLSSDPDGSIVSYAWSFGEGPATGTGLTTSHTYHSLGILTVSLTVTDNDGLTNTAFKTVTIRDGNNTFGCLTSLTMLRPAGCSGQNGQLRVNLGIGSNFTLRDGMGNTVPVSSGTDYLNLLAGPYLLTVNGSNGCSDTFNLAIPIDSTYCPGWQPDACRMAMGTNSSGFADWESERPLRNLMKHIREEIVTYTDACNCWNVNMQSELLLDADGYPLQIPQATSAGNVRARLILSSENGNLQIGREYVLRYDGMGTLVMQGAVNVVSNTPGRIQFVNLGGGNIYFNLTASQLGNHVRNIRLLRLADEDADIVAHPFYEGYLDKIAPFTALRFMDWAHTNNNPIVAWSDRTPVTYRTYGTSTGVPYEIMVQLSNYTQKDAWVCVPHAADEDYIRQMARLFRDSLDPHLTIYLEYSNEVWNWLFAQAHYNVQTAPSNLNYGRAYAEKSRRVFALWNEEFGAQSSRIKRVLGLQAGFNYLNEQILSQLPADEWDYGSPTWYFGLNHGAGGNPVLHAGSTPQDVVLNARNAWLGFKDVVKRDYDNVKLFGKGIIAYEGGQHFTDFSVPPYIQAMYDAQYTQEIYDLYDDVLDTIRAWGAELPFAFSLAGRQESIYGSWGHVSDIDTPQPYLTTAPKYQALLDNTCLPPCPSVLVVGNNQPIPSGTYQASQRIVSYGNVPSGSNVILRAGEQIELPATFGTDLGGELLVEPGDCTPASNMKEPKMPASVLPKGKEEE